MITITHDAAIEALRFVVAEAGNDFVYYPPVPDSDTCYYVHDGACSCGVSRALHHLGVPIEVLSSLDTAAPGAPFGSPAGIYSYKTSAILERAGFDISQATRVFDAFQRAQDRQHKYADALNAAELVAV